MPNEHNSENECPTAIIDENLFIARIIQSPLMQSIPSCPRWHGEKGGQGVIKLYLPKYIFSPPQCAPQCAQKCKTVSGHLGNAVSHVVDSCLSVPSPRPTVLALPHHPALSSGTLG